MKTAKEIESEFLKDFDALLKKYQATFKCEDEFQGYPECGEDIHARITILSKYENGEHISEYTDIDLGCYRTID